MSITTILRLFITATNSLGKSSSSIGVFCYIYPLPQISPFCFFKLTLNGLSCPVVKQFKNSISAAQQKSATMQREVQFDNPTVSLEETMIAMQKAQLGFQSAVQVRNKLVQAYTDIMNMQV